MRVIAILVVPILVYCFALPVHAADHQWIVGTWGLAHDPDGNKKDWLEFTADGRAYAISDGGRRMAGEYSIVGSEVRIVYQHKGKSIPITLRYTPNKQRLLAYSDRTGNTSEYVKEH